jgi:hypothetical protein
MLSALGDERHPGAREWMKVQAARNRPPFAGGSRLIACQRRQAGSASGKKYLLPLSS